jgi:hypothetical protein
LVSSEDFELVRRRTKAIYFTIFGAFLILPGSFIVAILVDIATFGNSDTAIFLGALTFISGCIIGLYNAYLWSKLRFISWTKQAIREYDEEHNKWTLQAMSEYNQSKAERMDYLNRSSFSSLEELDERFIEGEIDEETYIKIKSEFTKKSKNK